VPRKPRPISDKVRLLDRINTLDASELVATLKQIKDLHRNPIIHPEETLDMIEAQMLTGIMQSAIFAMIQIVKGKQKQVATTVTPQTP
jgi:hypothetical protein